MDGYDSYDNRPLDDIRLPDGGIPFSDSNDPWPELTLPPSAQQSQQPNLSVHIQQPRQSSYQSIPSSQPSTQFEGAPIGAATASRLQEAQQIQQQWRAQQQSLAQELVQFDQQQLQDAESRYRQYLDTRKIFEESGIAIGTPAYRLVVGTTEGTPITTHDSPPVAPHPSQPRQSPINPPTQPVDPRYVPASRLEELSRQRAQYQPVLGTSLPSTSNTNPTQDAIGQAMKVVQIQHSLGAHPDPLPPVTIAPGASVDRYHQNHPQDVEDRRDFPARNARGSNGKKGRGPGRQMKPMGSSVAPDRVERIFNVALKPLIVIPAPLFSVGVQHCLPGKPSTIDNWAKTAAYVVLGNAGLSLQMQPLARDTRWDEFRHLINETKLQTQVDRRPFFQIHPKDQYG